MKFATLYAPSRANAAGAAFADGSAPAVNAGCATGLMRYLLNEKSTPPTTADDIESKTRGRRQERQIDARAAP